MPETACELGTPLTRGETRVLELLSQGCSIAEAAQQLWVTQSAIKYHIRHAYRKLGARNRRELITAFLTSQRTGSANGVVVALDQSLAFLEIALQRAKETGRISTIPTPNLTATG